MSVRDHTTTFGSSGSRSKTGPRWWCETCGDDLPPRPSGGRYQRFCTVDCGVWALQDAKKRRVKHKLILEAIAFLRKKEAGL